MVNSIGNKKQDDDQSVWPMFVAVKKATYGLFRGQEE